MIDSSQDHSGQAGPADGSTGAKTRRYRGHYGGLIHLAPVFGADRFGQKAESFARYFGTPHFLVIQTAIVLLWMGVNIIGFAHFDKYPFILLNLAFSLQAAYAAPLILLAQTRQADRDKATTSADALHREEIAAMSERRQELMATQSAQLLTLLEQNTRITELSADINRRVEALTRELHAHLLDAGHPPGAPQEAR